MQRHALAATLIGAAVIAASCGSSGTKTTSSPTTAGSTGSAGAFARSHYTTPLAGVCPNPVVVQADWVPEADHGFLYQMIGAGGKRAQFSYEGPLGATGIDLRILAGGPGLGSGASQPSSLYTGNLVKGVTPTLAFVSSDDAIQYSKQYPTTAVFGEYAKSPQVIMFDPTKYQISDLPSMKAAVAKGAKIYVESTTFSFVHWLISQGIPSDAFIGGYAGDLEKFVGSGGSLLNQGFSTNEVFKLEHETPTWDKKVGYVYLADLGLPFAQSAVSVASNKLAALSGCLQKLVPLMQHSLADYVAAPGEVNGLLNQLNPTYSVAFWHTPVDLNNAATKTMLSDKLVADTSGTSSVGGFDMTQVEKIISELLPVDTSQGLTTMNPSVAGADIATNRFIDPSVGVGP
ncbi:MAG: hypothetical protein M3Y91_06030 [Actinomycetota bacterium]|nr:hypothetical protein [Actinomycetota bacterium]